MKRSTDRILTTHVGSLARTPAILEGMKARTLNRAYDPDKLAQDVREGIREVVHKQAEVGIDIPSHGELGRPGFRGYVSERLGGLGVREPTEEEASDPFRDLSVAERPFFPGFFEQYYGHYRYLWMPLRSTFPRCPTGRVRTNTAASSGRSRTPGGPSSIEKLTCSKKRCMV